MISGSLSSVAERKSLGSPIAARLRSCVGVNTTQPGLNAVLFGQLDAQTVGQVREDLHLLIDSGTGEVVLDLNGVVVADSCGLALLVSLHRRARIAGRTLVLLDSPARLNSLIRRTRLHRVLVCRCTNVP